MTYLDGLSAISCQ